MRIASNTVSDNIVRQIQQLSSQQAKLQNQVSTGQRISQPEDDPAAVGRVLNLESERRQLTQYGNNASTALAVAQASSSGLQAMKKISDRAGQLATLGTGVLGADAMTADATEVDQMIEQAVQTANTQFSGNYIYAGTAVAVPPVSATRDANGQVTSVAYVGNATQAAIPLSDAASVTPGTDGATNTSLADFINNLVSLRDALKSGENTLVSAIADNGGVQTRIEASQSQQTDRQTSLDALVSSEVDADMPSTIVKLTQTQTAYQAALQSAAKIMNLSLLDYIK